MSKNYMQKTVNYVKENLSCCLCIVALMITLFVIYRVVPPTADLWTGSWVYNNAGGLFQYL